MKRCERYSRFSVRHRRRIFVMVGRPENWMLIVEELGCDEEGERDRVNALQQDCGI